MVILFKNNWIDDLDNLFATEKSDKDFFSNFIVVFVKNVKDFLL